MYINIKKTFAIKYYFYLVDIFFFFFNIIYYLNLLCVVFVFKSSTVIHYNIHA